MVCVWKQAAPGYGQNLVTHLQHFQSRDRQTEVPSGKKPPPSGEDPNRTPTRVWRKVLAKMGHPLTDELHFKPQGLPEKPAFRWWSDARQFNICVAFSAGEVLTSFIPLPGTTAEAVDRTLRSKSATQGTAKVWLSPVKLNISVSLFPQVSSHYIPASSFTDSRVLPVPKYSLQQSEQVPEM